MQVLTTFITWVWVERKTQQYGAYARTHGFAIVSKISDFAEQSVLKGAPPKVLWLRLGNCSTSEVERVLRSAREAIRSFLEGEDQTCLLLWRAEPSS